MEEESKNLLPTVDVPDFVDEEEDEEYDVDYKPSPMWDLEKGDFVRTAANNVPMNDGYEAYKIWCVKTVSTERYSCLGYSDDHGTETEDITRESDQSTVELSLERTIQEALMVNPRTSSVEEFSFEWGTVLFVPKPTTVTFIFTARRHASMPPFFLASLRIFTTTVPSFSDL